MRHIIDIVLARCRFIGREVPVKLYGKTNNGIDLIAKVDTGAFSSSINRGIAEKIGYSELCKILDMNEFKKRFVSIPTNVYEKQFTDKFISDMKKNYSDLYDIRIINSSNGYMHRPFIKIKLQIGGKEKTAIVNIVDRASMKYGCILGRRELKGFLIDVEKTI